MTDRTTSRVPALLLCYCRRLGVGVRLNDAGDGLTLTHAERLCATDRNILKEWKSELVTLLKSQAEINEVAEIRDFLDRLPMPKKSGPL